MAIEHDCPLITIIHTNPFSDKERGHLGSQLQRKAESVIGIKSEGDISFIEPKYLRNAGKGSIAQIQFTYDKVKGYHVSSGERIDDKAGDRLNNLKKIVEAVFGGQKSYLYGEAIEKIMKHTTRKERSAKEIFKELKAHSMIVQGEDKRYRSQS